MITQKAKTAVFFIGDIQSGIVYEYIPGHIQTRLRSLPTGQIRLSSIELERPIVAITLKANGKVEFPLPLPAPGAGEAGEKQGPQVAISQLRVHDARIDLTDLSVPHRPVRLRLEKVEAAVQQLAIPLAPGKSPLEFEGLLRGRQADGRVRLSGWVEPITQDASVKATLRSIDLTLLTPYLLKVQEVKVDRGRLDMDLDFQVGRRKVHAPGKATISDLQLRSAPGLVNSFMGLPRQGVLNLLKSRDGKIELAFLVEGDLNDPRFRLQQSFVTAMAAMGNLPAGPDGRPNAHLLGLAGRLRLYAGWGARSKSYRSSSC